MGVTTPNNAAGEQDVRHVPEVRRLRPSKSLQRIASIYKQVRDASPIRLSTEIKHRISAIKSTVSPKPSMTSLDSTATLSHRNPSLPGTKQITGKPMEYAGASFLKVDKAGGDVPAASPQRGSWFALPAEIREQIYSYAFSGKSIHIHRERLVDDKLSAIDMALYEDVSGHFYSVGYTLCCAEQTDHVAYAQTKLSNEEGQDVTVAHWQDRHKDCRRASPHRQFELPVALLRTCRQINFEAAHVLYCQNTFCFQSSTDLDFFLGRVLAPRNRKDLREVRIHAEHVFISAPFEGLSQTTVDQLAGLKFLGLTVGWYRMTGLQPFLPLFSNTLERVEIIIGPKKPNTAVNTAIRNRQLAEEMENHLLSIKQLESH